MGEPRETRPRKPRTTFRLLLLAWCAVAAIVVVAWFVNASDECVTTSLVNARYERQPLRTSLEAPIAQDEIAPVATRDDVAVLVTARALPEGTGRIHGKVTDRDTREPVAGVRVILRDSDGSYRQATTGATGDYEHRSLPKETYTLGAASDEADVLEEITTQPVRLAEGGDVCVDFSVSRAGRVWGTVTNERNEPIAGATVLLGTGDSIVTQVAKIAASQRQPLGARTDDHGRYVIRGVPFEHEWLVWVDHDEHAPVLSPPFVLHVSRPQVRLDVTLLAGTVVRGRVVETSRKPIARAQVVCVPRYTAFLAPMRKAQTARESKTDEDGRFVLGGLPPGEYQVMAFKEAYRIELKGTPVYPDGRTPIELELVLKPVTEGDHVVFGTVVDGAGAAVPGAKVGLAMIGVESLSLGARDTETGSDGSFRFEGVSEGQFLLVADKSGFRQATVSVTADQEARVALERRSGISGTVQLSDGTPADAFSVRVVSSAGNPFDVPVRSFQDAQGHFELDDVAPGHVLLEASAASFAPARVELDVTRGQWTTGVLLRLSDTGARIHGRVSAASGAVRGAMVTLAEVGDMAFPFSKGAAVATTDENGEFVLERLAATTWQVHVTHPDHAPATLTVLARADETAEASVTLTDGGTIKGQAGPGAMVTVAGDALSTMLATDESGAFQVGHVPAGTYLARSLVADESSIARAPDVHRRSVSVTDGQTTEVDLLADDPNTRAFEGRTTPPPKGGFAMVLLRVPGSPAPDPTRILFQSRLGASVGDGESSRYVVGEGLVASDGTFALRGVPPGRYTQDVYVTTVAGTLTGQKAALRESKEVVVE